MTKRVSLSKTSHTLYIGTHDVNVIAYDTETNKVKGEIKLSDAIKTIKTGKTFPLYSLRQLILDKKNQRLYIPGIDWSGSVLVPLS